MKLEGMDQLYVMGGGKEIVYYAAGQTGSPLVLLHGGGVDSAWQRSEYQWNGIKSDYTSRLGENRNPTLILHGDHNMTVPVLWAERAHQAIPGSRATCFSRTADIGR